MVEMASSKFVCIVDDTKMVEGLGGSKLAMPVEIVQFCHLYTLRRLAALPEVAGCEAKLRMEGDKPYVTDNSNYIVDLYFQVHRHTPARMRARMHACTVHALLKLAARPGHLYAAMTCQRLDRFTWHMRACVLHVSMYARDVGPTHRNDLRDHL